MKLTVSRWSINFKNHQKEKFTPAPHKTFLPQQISREYLWANSPEAQL